ncbi:hypothetical protein [Pseudoduganella flava]|uniref:Uncharacterized protein n=1 Tax=Pseudoduganella flava TaxID=871742 RepID=A0ABX6FZ29_9BURK|nr:hypothetical protein [Pseudoduganella flava]QGZ42381.1 hypothetical protein GO485_27350 [Pseudoduganella flava]
MSYEKQLYEFPLGGSEYRVTLLRSGAELTLLSVRPRYKLRIARKLGATGHELDVPIFDFDDDVIAYLNRSQITESGEGITFNQPSGHTLFVPKRWYEAGR